MNPLEVAMLIDRSTSEVRRDPATGLYVLDGTVPPTFLTLADYERGLRILHLREKVATGTRPERS